MFGYLLLVVSAYLIGSISSAIVVCRLMGLPDPRTQGSQNPGATNVLRFGGKKAGAVVLVGDMLKALLPVLALNLAGLPVEALAIVGFAAFLGHLYPVYFKFKGGKGVATYLGVMLGLFWPLGLATAATWLVMASIFRISSLAALTAAALTPLYAWLLIGNFIVTVLLGIMTLILLWRHRSNIQNLLAGTEGRIGGK